MARTKKKTVEQIIESTPGLRAKNGRLEYRFTYQGKTYSVSGDYSIAGANDCIIKAEEKKRKIDEGSYVQNRDITFKRYCEEWLKMHEGTVKPITINNYRKKLNLANKYIGDVKVRSLERRQIIEARKKIAEDHMTSTANSIVVSVKMVLNSAVDDKIISSNPTESIKSLKRTEQKITENSHRALSDNEIKLFFKYAEQYSFLCNLYKFLLHTGMRCGEATSLYWSDIDYKEDVIHIRKSMSRDEEDKAIISDSPKNTSSYRDIPLTEDLKAILKAQKELLSQSFGNVINPLIFVGQRGKMQSTATVDSNIRYVLSMIANDNNNLEPFSVHSFRDSYATIAVRNGVPLLTVAKILGHANLNMLSQIYAQINNEDKKQAAEKIVFAV